MARNTGKDNINDGDAHGQGSFESAGVLLPIISKEQYDREKNHTQRRGLKSFSEMTADDILERANDVLYAALEFEKPDFKAAGAMVNTMADIVGVRIKTIRQEEAKPSDDQVKFYIPTNGRD